MTSRTSVWNSSGRWSRPEVRTRLRTRCAPRVAINSDVAFLTPSSASVRNFGDHGISTVSDPFAHHPPAIVGGNVVGQYLRQRVPVAGCEARVEAFADPRRRVFQSACLRGLSCSNLASAASRSASSNSSQRVNLVAFDCQKVDLAPLDVETLLRSPLCRVGDDRSEVAKPMHGVDVDVDVYAEIPCGLQIFEEIAGRERCCTAMVDVLEVRRCRGEFAGG